MRRIVDYDPDAGLIRDNDGVDWYIGVGINFTTAEEDVPDSPENAEPDTQSIPINHLQTLKSSGFSADDIIKMFQEGVL